MIMSKKKPYEKPECKKFFVEPRIKKHGKINKFIGGSLEPPHDCSDCPKGDCCFNPDCPADP